jgi:hypothetical protein
MKASARFLFLSRHSRPGGRRRAMGLDCEATASWLGSTTSSAGDAAAPNLNAADDRARRDQTSGRQALFRTLGCGFSCLLRVCSLRPDNAEIWALSYTESSDSQNDRLWNGRRRPAGHTACAPEKRRLSVFCVSRCGDEPSSSFSITRYHRNIRRCDELRRDSRSLPADRAQFFQSLVSVAAHSRHHLCSISS